MGDERLAIFRSKLPRRFGLRAINRVIYDRTSIKPNAFHDEFVDKKFRDTVVLDKMMKLKLYGHLGKNDDLK